MSQFLCAWFATKRVLARIRWVCAIDGVSLIYGWAHYILAWQVKTSKEHSVKYVDLWPPCLYKLRRSSQRDGGPWRMRRRPEQGWECPDQSAPSSFPARLGRTFPILFSGLNWSMTESVCTMLLIQPWLNIFTCIQPIRLSRQGLEKRGCFFQTKLSLWARKQQKHFLLTDWLASSGHR